MVAIVESLFDHIFQDMNMRRREVLALATSGVAVASAGCLDVFDDDLTAPLTLGIFYHAHTPSPVHLTVLDEEDDVVLATTREMGDSNRSAVFDVVDEATEGDTFTVIVHAEAIDVADAGVVEVICPDTVEVEDPMFGFTVEVTDDSDVYIPGSASCT